MVKTKKLRAAGSHRSADSKGLPPGWIRVESRSKPGAYFYAHPATKRTQAEHPGERHISSKRPEGPRRRKTEGEAEEPGVSPLDVEDFEDPADKAERLRQEAEEAEAAEAARQEMVRQQRAAKRALLKEADKEKQEDEGGSEEEKELVSKEELAKWKQDEERREREEAEAERRRKEEEERRIKEEEKRRKEEERRREEEEQRIEAERIALWKARTEMARKEAEFEWAMSRERQKKEESDKIQLEAERVRQALLERKKLESEEEKKKAEADLRKKAEAERLRREAAANSQKNQRIEEPSDHIEAPCFDVFKGGERIGRFILSPTQTTWTIGRCPPIDIRAGHETVSRKHAQVNRQGCFTFLQDLGSAHGTLLNGQKLVKNTLERLCSGDNLRFGGSSRIYVYREPSTAIQINRGIRPVQVTIEQDIPEPALDSPKQAPALPGKPIVPIVPIVQPDESLATRPPAVTKLTMEHSPPAQAESPSQVRTGVVTDRAPAFESEMAVSGAEMLQQRQVPQIESAKTALKPEAEVKPEVQKPQKEGRKSKKSASSSSSTSSGKKKKKRRKSSKSKSRRKKSSSSSSSTSSRDKKRKESSKKKRRKSSSTSASTDKKRKKRKSRSKRKSSS
ncbi:unnamed protein product [Cladocopium goreaui]|uniref:Poly [ADP-ribose] polymerase 6 n=1 Tax=Cladocopium goreaui TaxID=2562237 RepID=A0A9P1CY39_9DINO|nr:unnamed protein product [Cladocopium goreaui]